MADVFSQLSAEISSFLTSTNKRECLITLAERFFDQVITPVDLPGPDQVIDPLLRAAIRPLVGRLYDETVKRLEAQTHAA